MIRAILVMPLLALLVQACGGGATGGSGVAAAPLEIMVAPVRLADVPKTLSLVGTLNAQERIAVSPEVGGIVAETPVDFGDRVEPGTLLLRLDDTEVSLRASAARAGVAQMDAVLAQARGRFERASALFKQTVLSKEEFDAATREIRVAEANRDASAKQLALAEKQVTDTEIRSPVGGFVEGRHVSAGQYVPAYTPVLQIVVVHPLKLHLDIPEHAIGAVRTGQPITVEVEAFPGEQFTATLTRVGSAIDETTRTLPIEGALPNPDGRLKPGQFAQAVLDLGRHKAIVVPRAAVTTFAGVRRSYVVRADGSVAARTIQAGLDLGEDVVITDGLSPGETVAVSHLERLADGVLVRHSTAPAS